MVNNSAVSERRLLWQQLGQMTSSTLTRIPLYQSSGTKLISTKKDTLKWMSFFVPESFNNQIIEVNSYAA